MRKLFFLSTPTLLYIQNVSALSARIADPLYTSNSSKSETLGNMIENIVVFLIIIGVIIGTLYLAYFLWKKSSRMLIEKTNPKKNETAGGIQGQDDSKFKKIGTHENSVGKLLTFLAFLGLIGSFFIPILVMDRESSFSLFQIMTKGEVPTQISDAIFSFMGQSFFAGFSILVAHINRRKLISLVGLFGIFFYVRALFSFMSHSESATNIFRILQKLGIGAEEVSKLVMSSPGFIVYSIASFFLILGGLSVITGYIQMYQEKTN